MTNTVSILGATGSVGSKAVAVAEHLALPVMALTTGRNAKLIAEQARRLKPKFVAALDERAGRELKIELADTDIRVGCGAEAIVEAALIEGVSCVLNAVSGAAGLKPTLAAVEAGRRIALANKETLVCAGELVTAAARKSGAEIVPVDSEHSAIFQCLMGRGRGELRKILLTGSGGPFRGLRWEELREVKPEQALKHPNWSMGAKITIDSATMMNKGLEFIEAMRLFDVSADEIEVVIHPQSIVHSMVELTDGTVIAQLGVADMGLPIQLAMTYPERLPSFFGRLDFAKLHELTFEAPDFEKMPCLRLAIECARAGGTAPCVMSAANEAAVGLFLQGKIGYTQIYDCAFEAVNGIELVENPDLETILAADSAAREYVTEHFI